MPVDFKRGFYHFPFEQLFDDLSLVSSDCNYCKYLSDWYSLLMAFEEKSKNEYLQKIREMNEYSKRKQRYEYFQYIQDFPSLASKYHYHFDIEQIRNTINFNDSRSAFSKRIAKNVSYNYFDKVDKNNLKNEPIILVPFFSPDLQYVVIDGNSRLSYYSRSHFARIKYCVLSPIEKRNFLLSIDWGMYWFSNEISTFLNSSNVSSQVMNSILYSSFFR